MTSEPKQHHYIPKCYSKNFVDENGFIHTSDLWNGARTYSSKPNNSFTARYMYSQPVHAEGRFDNRLEHFFSESVETPWTPVMEKLALKNYISQETWSTIVQFVISMQVRVPITFNSVIELLRKSVVEASAKIAPPPIPNSLIDHYEERLGRKANQVITLKDMMTSGLVEVNIDPHCCTQSMAHLAANVPIFQSGVSFGGPKVIHNCTDLAFISSDNPVCYFMGSPSDHFTRPYIIKPKRRISFVFPLSSTTALVNPSFVKKRGFHVEIYDREFIAQINRIISKFSYRYVFGKSKSLLAVGKKYMDICPRPIFEKSVIGDGVVRSIGYGFGRPVKIPNSWTYDIER